MYTGPLPPASIWGTWSEAIEIWDTETDTQMDLSGVTEIELILRDRRAGFNEFSLFMSDGDIVIPATGIVQWRVEASAMGTLEPKTYEVILLLSADDDTIPVLIGTVSIVD